MAIILDSMPVSPSNIYAFANSNQYLQAESKVRYSAQGGVADLRIRDFDTDLTYLLGDIEPGVRNFCAYLHKS